MANSIWKKAADLVGDDVIRKLARHGYSVVEVAAIDRFMSEHRKSNDRLREAAAASMRALGVVTVRLEMVDNDGTPTVIATAPMGKEQEMGRCAADPLAALWSPPAGWTPRREVPERDTTDVDIAAKEEEEPAPPGPV